ncbi:MAG TPA: HPr-rel-A system PqqD family peptide chaperone [Telluria sp.]|nr:HPr-rel-A system PqqD family peptide chaperone [Telluria sp.]
MGSAIWRVVPGQQLACRGWDREYVLYNSLSGDTHLLGEAALRVLRSLDGHPASAPALAALLGDDIDDTAGLLADLRALHLVEPVTC